MLVEVVETSVHQVCDDGTDEDVLICIPQNFETPKDSVKVVSFSGELQDDSALLNVATEDWGNSDHTLRFDVLLEKR